MYGKTDNNREKDLNIILGRLLSINTKKQKRGSTSKRILQASFLDILNFFQSPLTCNLDGVFFHRNKRAFQSYSRGADTAQRYVYLRTAVIYSHALKENSILFLMTQQILVLKSIINKTFSKLQDCKERQQQSH